MKQKSVNQHQRQIRPKKETLVTKTLAQKADERADQEQSKLAAGVANWMVNIGLLISAILTIIYLMLLVDDTLGLPSPYGMLFGLLVGVVAVIPAEFAMFVWRARLNAEREITTAQRNISVFAMFAAGLFSALTTSSFFSYFLKELFPPSYLAIAPALNIAAIVGSWIVFIMAHVGYSITSRTTRQNLAEAETKQGFFNSIMEVQKSAGEAYRTSSEAIVIELEQVGLFRDHAFSLVAGSLGVGAEELKTLLKESDGGEQDALPAPGNDEPEVVYFPAETNPAQPTIDTRDSFRADTNARSTNTNGSDFPLS